MKKYYAVVTKEEFGYSFGIGREWHKVPANTILVQQEQPFTLDDIERLKGGFEFHDIMPPETALMPGRLLKLVTITESSIVL